MLETPFFTVVIVNYNSGEFLQRAVQSLAVQTFSSFELMIVDNGSVDASMTTLSLSDIDQAQVIMMGNNAGFAKANNVAAKRARGDWLVLLNADAEARPDWLERIHAAIGRYPAVSMFASTQLRMDDPSRLDGAGDGYTAYGYPWRGGYLKPVSFLPSEGSCFSPCGASAAYKRDVYLAHGGFDERFFCYVEDSDLAFRMRLAGETCVFLPDAVVLHKGGGLAGEESEFSVVHGARNRVWAYAGNMPSLLFWLTLPAHLALTLYLIVWYARRPYGRYVRKGVGQGWSKAFAFRKERASLRKSRKVTLVQLAGQLTWNIFLMSSRRPDVRERKET